MVSRSTGSNANKLSVVAIWKTLYPRLASLINESAVENAR